MTATAPGSRDLVHPARDEIRLEAVLHALSDPMRLCLVRELAAAGRELTCSAIALPVSRSTATHHYRVLRESGIVRQSYRGTAKMTSLRHEELESLFPGLLASVLAAAGRQDARALAGRPPAGRAGTSPS